VPRPASKQLRSDIEALGHELERIGLLLHHDAELPSATALIAGQPIRGSWWGHPLGQRIYDALGAFEEQGGQLSPKLVNGKLTYIARHLWPAFLALARLHADGPLRLPQHGRKLLLTIGLEPVRVDQLDPTPFGGPSGLQKCVRALAQLLLADVGSRHTESGKHAMALTSWQDWAAGNAVEAEPSIEKARRQMCKALSALETSTRRAKTPFDGLLGR
jgi:hypothetical protein